MATNPMVAFCVVVMWSVPAANVSDVSAIKGSAYPCVVCGAVVVVASVNTTASVDVVVEDDETFPQLKLSEPVGAVETVEDVDVALLVAVAIAEFAVVVADVDVEDVMTSTARGASVLSAGAACVASAPACTLSCGCMAISIAGEAGDAAAGGAEGVSGSDTKISATGAPGDCGVDGVDGVAGVGGVGGDAGSASAASTLRSYRFMLCFGEFGESGDNGDSATPMGDCCGLALSEGSGMPSSSKPTAAWLKNTLLGRKAIQ